MDDFPHTVDDPGLPAALRDRIEEGLSKGVFGSIYVNNAAKVTVEIKLPETVTGEDQEHLRLEIERALQQLGQAVDRVVPETVTT